MIQINLLPEEIQKARKKRSISLKVNVVAISVVACVGAVFVFLHVILFGYNFFLNSRFSSLDSKYLELKPEADQIMYLKERTNTLMRKKNIVLDLIESRVLWAQKLNQLSDLIPGQVWLTNYEIKTKTEQVVQKVKMPDGTTMEKLVPTTYFVLEYEGGVVSLERREMLYIVGNFIANIKKSDVYFELFEDIELVNTEREKEKESGREYMTFKLRSKFKPGII